MKIIQPVSRLMSRINYRAKFMLLASFFVIPLALFAGSLAIKFNEKTIQLEHSREGIQHIQQATRLIQSLEEFRDFAILALLLNNDLFNKHFETTNRHIKREIDRLRKTPSLSAHYDYLDHLETQVESNQIFPGTEGVDVSLVFENANAMVKQAYTWRLKLSYEYIPFTEDNKKVIEIIDYINSSETNLLALGRTRAYGSYFLERQFINARGIELMEGCQSALIRLIDDTTINNTQTKFINKQQTNTALYIDQIELLTESLELLENEIIQAIDLTGSSAEFYEKQTAIIQSFYQYNYSLLKLADQQLADNYLTNRTSQIQFYSISILMVLALAYIVVGFFSYLKVTLRELIKFARRVADGEYQNPIKIDVQDEVAYLVSAMDTMREKLKVREEELKQFAQTDGLTQLNNRKYFDDTLPISIAHALRAQSPISLVLMDIDHFKSINDNYGHQVGDDCLIQAASIFKNRFKRSSDLAARYGGEEFVAILFGQNESEAREHIEELRERIALTSIESQGYKLSITASFGIATLYPSDKASPEQLIHLADQMLYKAKETGRNKVVQATFSISGQHQEAIE